MRLTVRRISYGHHYFILSIIFKTSCFCSAVSNAHLSSSPRCSLVSGTSSPSAKNSPSVIPNALQIVSSVEIVGSESLRKTCDSVDCAKPDSLHRRYTLQPRCSMSCSIRPSTSIVYHLFWNYSTFVLGRKIERKQALIYFDNRL